MKRYISALLIGAASLLPHSTPAEPKNGTALVEYNDKGNWYSVKGLRTALDYKSPIGDISAAYVPTSNEDSNGKSHDAHDGHIIWTWPQNITGNLIDAKTGFSHTEKNGFGGSISLTYGAPSDTSERISWRLGFSEDKTGHSQIKWLSKNIDAVAGMKRDHIDGVAKSLDLNPYGYVTVNGGKWDDTFTLGIAPDNTVWNNFSLGRENTCIFSITGYNYNNKTWTSGTYFGLNDVNRSFFTRSVDRLVANNDITPKPRSLILYFPSYLVMGELTGEVRLDKSNEKTFVNLCIGRTFTFDTDLGDLKIGIGSGLEVTDIKKTHYGATAEILTSLSNPSISITGMKRIRKNENGLYLAASRNF